MLKFLQDFTKFRDSFKDFKTSNGMLNGITKVPEFIIGTSNFDYEQGEFLRQVSHFSSKIRI